MDQEPQTIVEVPCPKCRKPKVAMSGSSAAKAGVLPGPCFECWLDEKKEN